MKSKKPTWVASENKAAAAIWSAIENGELKPVKDSKARVAKAMQMVQNTLKKDARINIRLPQQDVTKIKEKAGVLGFHIRHLSQVSCTNMQRVG